MAYVFQESIISGFFCSLCVCVFFLYRCFILEIKFEKPRYENNEQFFLDFISVFGFLANFLKKLIKENIETKKTIKFQLGKNWFPRS